MSPTVYRDGPFRFFFFSREEMRPHVHVYCGDGEAKYWITPDVALAFQRGMSEKQLRDSKRSIEEHINEIHDAWNKHFPS